MSDTYLNFKALESNEKGNFEIECIDKSSDVTLIAPHAGCIESSTKNIAKSIAGKIFNYYAFVGKRRQDCYKYLHITSHNFDEPKALELVGKSKYVISIHGCMDEQEDKQKKKINYGKKIFIGGLDEDLINKLQETLENASLPVSFLSKFAGEEPKNICNRGTTRKGIQFELTRSFRKSDKLREKFIFAVSECLKQL